MTSATSFEIAKVLPSLSLSQAVLSSPVVAMPFYRLESREVVLFEPDALAAQLADGALHVLAGGRRA